MSYQNQSLAKRIAIFSFNIMAYGIGAASLVYLILVYGSIINAQNGPVFMGPSFNNVFLSVLWNALLVVGFGYKHSVMASIKFKEKITKWIPDAVNRGFYLLATAGYLVFIIAFWSPVEGVLWQSEGAAYVSIMSVFLFGWGFLFIATFMIDHFELFGLKQGYYYLKNMPTPELKFVKTGFYAYVRHPIMTGMLIGIWCIPTMTNNHLIMSVFLSVYVWIGVYFEERKLKRILGEQYTQYCEEVGSVLPKIRLFNQQAVA